jgi:hypothetical protein
VAVTSGSTLREGAESLVERFLGSWSGRTRPGGLFEARFGVPEREYRGLVAAMQREWEQHHSLVGFTVVPGRKPA